MIIFLVFSSYFNVKKGLNQDIYVQRINKNPDNADPPRLVFLLA